MKTKTISLVLVCAFLLVACGGAAPSWQDFSSDKGKFTVTMPATPKESSQSVDTAAGKIDLYLYTAQVGTSAYLVSFSDYPADMMSQADPAKVLDGAMNGAVTNISGTILSSQDITLSGNPGKDFSAEGKIKNPGDGSVRGRIYLVKNRLYQIIVVGMKDQIPTADADKYLQSFKLK
ncbi:MAG: hypothetical protein M1434_12605 [Chloroflexi bacterium]|nr:hypothetical protein [Chloroflexota bacterium]